MARRHCLHHQVREIVVEMTGDTAGQRISLSLASSHHRHLREAALYMKADSLQLDMLTRSSPRLGMGAAHQLRIAGHCT